MRLFMRELVYFLGMGMSFICFGEMNVYSLYYGCIYNVFKIICFNKVRFGRMVEICF